MCVWIASSDLTALITTLAEFHSLIDSLSAARRSGFARELLNQKLSLLGAPSVESLDHVIETGALCSSRRISSPDDSRSFP